MSRGFVIMSGLPASGKSRLGSAIASRLGLPFLDKDDFLEPLFGRDGTGDAGWRERLSREADDLFGSAAIASKGAVLASFWRHPGRANGGGTPSDWLRTLPGPLVEVHCRCPAGLAQERFQARKRHPGHLDAGRRGEDLRGQFGDYAVRGPLGIGNVISVETSGSPGTRALAARIRSMLDSDAC